MASATRMAAERLATVEGAWDELVGCAEGGDLVQTSAWARAKRAVGLGTRLVVVRGRDGEIAGGALILLKRLAPGVAAGSVARGPLLRDPSVDAGHVVNAVVREARSCGARLLIVQPPEGGERAERALVARGFQAGCPSVAPEATIRLDLRRSDDELLADMIPARRRKLRRGAPASLEIAQETGVEPFARLHAATAARQRFRPLDVATLQAQWDALAPSGRCIVLIARHRGVPLSGIWLTSFAGVTTFRLAGWDAEAVASGAPGGSNEALHWAAIRRARASGERAYDLGGLDRQVAEVIARGGKPPEGFARSPAFFKYGFGGSAVLLPVARWGLTGMVSGALRPLARRLLTHDRARSAMARARNG